MKKFFVVLLVLFCLTLGENISALPINYFDKVFASYTLSASAVEEKIHLENFAIALKRDSETVGIIRYFHENRKFRDKVKAGAIKARKYLIRRFKLDADRLQVVDGGKLPFFSTIELDFTVSEAESK